MAITNETPGRDKPAVHQVPGGDREHHQQQVTGEHVGEESYGVRERPDQDVREELDDHDERKHRAERLVVAGEVLEPAHEAVLRKVRIIHVS